MLDRTIPPPQSSHIELNFSKVQYQKLSSPVKVYSLSVGSQPVIKLEAIFPFGGSYYEYATATSLLSIQMLREGTSHFSSSEISNGLARYGAFLEISPSFDVPSLSLYSLSKHLKSVLPYYKGILAHSIFPEAEFETLKHIQIENLRAQNKKNSIVATKTFRKLLFGPDHPYGRQITEESLQTLEVNQVQNFYHSNLTHFELLISGKFDQAILKEIDLQFSDLSHGPFHDEKSEVKLMADLSATSINEPSETALQSSIRVGKLMVPKQHKDYIPILVVNHILGGYFGSRLMKNIREDKGFTYGVHSSIVSLKNSTYLSISTDVIKAHAEDTIFEIKKELDLLASELVDEEEELTTVKNHLIGSFQSQLNSPFSLMNKFKQVYVHGLDYSYYDNYLSLIRDIRPDEIRKIAQKYFQPAKMKQVIIG